MVSRQTQGEAGGALMNRRDFLKLMGATALFGAGHSLSLTQSAPLDLEQGILNAIGRQEMGFSLRKLDDEMRVVFSINYNADKLYPVASCFKVFLLYYYFWNTPQEQWKTDRESAAYRVGVFSDNVKTGVLIRDTGEFVTVYGNPMEKFNDCILLNLGLKHGLHKWEWEGNPMVGFTDPRFEPSTERFIEIRGTSRNVDNLTTSTDLANGYVFLAQAAEGKLPPNPKNPYFDTARAQLAATATLDLLSIPAENYKSPMERGFGSYTGKDGVLQPEDLGIGYVVNDAGLVTVGESRYSIALISVGQTEYSTVLTLTAIHELLKEYEGVQRD
jgi:hypothetical protein